MNIELLPAHAARAFCRSHPHQQPKSLIRYSNALNLPCSCQFVAFGRTLRFILLAGATTLSGALESVRMW